MGFSIFAKAKKILSAHQPVYHAAIWALEQLVGTPADSFCGSLNAKRGASMNHRGCRPPEWGLKVTGMLVTVGLRPASIEMTVRFAPDQGETDKAVTQITSQAPAPLSSRVRELIHE